MTSTHEAELPIPLLPLAARRAHIVPDLQSHSLISIGALCDAGCDVNFTTTHVTVRHDNSVIMTGTREPPGLWHFEIPVPTPPDQASTTEAMAMSTIGYSNAPELVAYAHAALFSPALSTLETALKRGYVRNFPGLTAKTLRRHPPRSVATAKGHLDQVRKNLRSTKVPSAHGPSDTTKPQQPPASPDELFPTHEERTHQCYVTVHNLDEPTGKVYAD